MGKVPSICENLTFAPVHDASLEFKDTSYYGVVGNIELSSWSVGSGSNLIPSEYDSKDGRILLPPLIVKKCQPL